MFWKKPAFWFDMVLFLVHMAIIIKKQEITFWDLIFIIATKVLVHMISKQIEQRKNRRN